MTLEKRGKLLKYSAAVAIAILCLSAAIVVGSIYRARLVQENAEKFLEELKTLNIETMTFQEVARFAQKHRGFVPDRAPSCSEQKCDYDFVFENKPLSSLRLAPYTRLGATISVGNSHVSRISSGLFSRVPDLPQGQPYLEVYLAEWRRGLGVPTPSAQASGVSVWPNFDVRHKLWRTGTDLWPQASRSVRDQAYDFNLSCLSRLRGCRTFGDLMKSPWPPPELIR